MTTFRTIANNSLKAEFPRMDLMHLEVDGTSRKLIFHGDCQVMRPVCKAMCCRHEWSVPLSAEEHASGQYESEVFCLLSYKTCKKTARACVHHRFRLHKREDKSCIYLEEDRCQIYARRPEVCRKTTCSGWILHDLLPATHTLPVKTPPAPLRETFLDGVNENMTFVLHPLIKLHTIFYIKQRREIVFVKEMIGGCGKFNTKDSFDLPQLDDGTIMSLIDLFGRKETLGKIYRIFCGQNTAELSINEFFGIVWLLNKHTIVLNSNNFEGMLEGMGDLD